ncbi:MAG: hypothetical protein ACE14L_08585 [Terriglobales bacterium]
MSVLSVVLVYVVAAAVAILLFVCWLRSLQLQYVEAQEDGEAFSAIPMSLALEPESAIVWSTQIPALELIASASAQGVSTKRLCRRYMRDARDYPELYDGSSFREWLHFLQSSHLVAWNGDRIVLTPDGRNFLHLYQTGRLPASPVRGPAQ